jgi:hypothetical protein
MSGQSRAIVVLSTQLVARCMLPLAAVFCFIILFPRPAGALPLIDTTTNLLKDTAEPQTEPLLGGVKKSLGGSTNTSPAPSRDVQYQPKESMPKQQVTTQPTSSTPVKASYPTRESSSPLSTNNNTSTAIKQNPSTNLISNIRALSFLQIKDNFMTPLDRVRVKYAAAQRLVPSLTAQTQASTKGSWLEASSVGWKVFGVAWYWWIFGLGIGLSAVSAIRYRGDSRGQIAGVLNATK